MQSSDELQKSLTETSAGEPLAQHAGDKRKRSDAHASDASMTANNTAETATEATIAGEDLNTQKAKKKIRRSPFIDSATAAVHSISLDAAAATSATAVCAPQHAEDKSKRSDAHIGDVSAIASNTAETATATATSATSLYWSSNTNINSHSYSAFPVNETKVKTQRDHVAPLLAAEQSQNASLNRTADSTAVDCIRSGSGSRYSTERTHAFSSGGCQALGEQPFPLLDDGTVVRPMAVGPMNVVRDLDPKSDRELTLLLGQHYKIALELFMEKMSKKDSSRTISEALASDNLLDVRQEEKVVEAFLKTREGLAWVTAKPQRGYRLLELALRYDWIAVLKQVLQKTSIVSDEVLEGSRVLKYRIGVRILQAAACSGDPETWEIWEKKSQELGQNKDSVLLTAIEYLSINCFERWSERINTRVNLREGNDKESDEADQIDFEIDFERILMKRASPKILQWAIAKKVLNVESALESECIEYVFWTNNLVWIKKVMDLPETIDMLGSSDGFVHLMLSNLVTVQWFLQRRDQLIMLLNADHADLQQFQPDMISKILITVARSGDLSIFERLLREQEIFDYFYREGEASEYEYAELLILAGEYCHSALLKRLLQIPKVLRVAMVNVLEILLEALTRTYSQGRFIDRDTPKAFVAIQQSFLQLPGVLERVKQDARLKNIILQAAAYERDLEFIKQVLEMSEIVRVKITEEHKPFNGLDIIIEDEAAGKIKVIKAVSNRSFNIIYYDMIVVGKDSTVMEKFKETLISRVQENDGKKTVESLMIVAGSKIFEFPPEEITDILIDKIKNEPQVFNTVFSDRTNLEKLLQMPAVAEAIFSKENETRFADVVLLYGSEQLLSIPKIMEKITEIFANRTQEYKRDLLQEIIIKGRSLCAELLFKQIQEQTVVGDFYLGKIFSWLPHSEVNKLISEDDKLIKDKCLAIIVKLFKLQEVANAIAGRNASFIRETMIFAIYTNLNAFKTLLNIRAIRESVHTRNNQLLCIAARIGSVKAVGLLLQIPLVRVILKENEEEDIQALWEACAHGRANVVDLLLNYKENVGGQLLLRDLDANDHFALTATISNLYELRMLESVADEEAVDEQQAINRAKEFLKEYDLVENNYLNIIYLLCQGYYDRNLLLPQHLSVRGEKINNFFVRRHSTLKAFQERNLLQVYEVISLICDYAQLPVSCLFGSDATARMNTTKYAAGSITPAGVLTIATSASENIATSNVRPETLSNPMGQQAFMQPAPILFRAPSMAAPALTEQSPARLPQGTTHNNGGSQSMNTTLSRQNGN